MATETKSSRIRAGLSHPILDSDGHLIEFLPAVRDYLVEEGGREIAERFDGVVRAMGSFESLPLDEQRAMGLFKMTWWAYPARNALDRATGMLPGLLYERLAEFGLDFAVLYPTLGLTALSLDDTELRGASIRAFNRCSRDLYAPYSDRLTPAAMIPMTTPSEAIAELEFSKDDLGMKAFVLNGFVYRPLGEGLPRGARWVDSFGPESPYDYDPVWNRCVELGVAPTFHSSAMGFGTRVSQSNYVHNHIGNFSQAGEATCRSLFMGGVLERHPALRCAFLEGGVAWAAGLYSDLVGHFEKRGPLGIEAYDPESMDRALIRSLFESHGSERYKRHLDEFEESLRILSKPGDRRDDFAASGIRSAEDIRDVFVRNFRFGCEADDPMNAMAFDEKTNPLGARLRAIFSSDIGHWDVPDMSRVVEEAWELVEDGHFSERDFQEFSFSNAATMYAEADPGFFAGTKIETAVADLLSNGSNG